MAITEQQLEAGELSSGDPCYSVEGHVDREEMLDAVRRHELSECEIPILESTFDLEDVHYKHRRTATHEEARSMGFETAWFFCKPDEDGARPVTVVYP